VKRGEEAFANSTLQINEPVPEAVHRDLAGALAGNMSAHAIGYEEQPAGSDLRAVNASDRMAVLLVAALTDAVATGDGPGV
jgi:hypothetical protein